MARPENRPQVIGHRGARAAAPENTLAAFRQALAIGVDAVELDVHLSADGEPVVIHDLLLDRTTDGHGLVGALPLHALRRLDAGSWFGQAFAGERIPTLGEALELLRAVRVIIELKNLPVRYPGIVDGVAAVVRGSGHADVTVSSFDHPLLQEVRVVAPSLEVAVLYSARPIHAVHLAQDVGARVLHPDWLYLTPDVVAAAHEAGLRVETWVVDEPDDLARAVAVGPDGIMTAHPQRLRAVLARLGHPLPRIVSSS